MKGSLVSWEEQQGEPWRKVAEDLLAWYRGIYLFREKKTKVEATKRGSEKVSLETLKKEFKS